MAVEPGGDLSGDPVRLPASQPGHRLRGVPEPAPSPARLRLVCGLLALGVLGLLLIATDRLLSGRVLDGVLMLVGALGGSIVLGVSLRATRDNAGADREPRRRDSRDRRGAAGDGGEGP